MLYPIGACMALLLGMVALPYGVAIRDAFDVGSVLAASDDLLASEKGDLGRDQAGGKSPWRDATPLWLCNWGGESWYKARGKIYFQEGYKSATQLATDIEAGKVYNAGVRAGYLAVYSDRKEAWYVLYRGGKKDEAKEAIALADVPMEVREQAKVVERATKAKTATVLPAFKPGDLVRTYLEIEYWMQSYATSKSYPVRIPAEVLGYVMQVSGDGQTPMTQIDFLEGVGLHWVMAADYNKLTAQVGKDGHHLQFASLPKRWKARKALQDAYENKVHLTKGTLVYAFCEPSWGEDIEAGQWFLARITTSPGAGSRQVEAKVEVSFTEGSRKLKKTRRNVVSDLRHVIPQKPDKQEVQGLKRAISQGWLAGLSDKDPFMAEAIEKMLQIARHGAFDLSVEGWALYERHLKEQVPADPFGWHVQHVVQAYDNPNGERDVSFVHASFLVGKVLKRRRIEEELTKGQAVWVLCEESWDSSQAGVWLAGKVTATHTDVKSQVDEGFVEVEFNDGFVLDARKKPPTKRRFHVPCDLNYVKPGQAWEPNDSSNNLRLGEEVSNFHEGGRAAVYKDEFTAVVDEAHNARVGIVFIDGPPGIVGTTKTVDLEQDGFHILSPGTADPWADRLQEKRKSLEVGAVYTVRGFKERGFEVFNGKRCRLLELLDDEPEKAGVGMLDAVGNWSIGHKTKFPLHCLVKEERRSSSSSSSRTPSTGSGPSPPMVDFRRGWPQWIVDQAGANDYQTGQMVRVALPIQDPDDQNNVPIKGWSLATIVEVQPENKKATVRLANNSGTEVVSTEFPMDLRVKAMTPMPVDSPSPVMLRLRQSRATGRIRMMVFDNDCTLTVPHVFMGLAGMGLNAALDYELMQVGEPYATTELGQVRRIDAYDRVHGPRAFALKAFGDEARVKKIRAFLRQMHEEEGIVMVIITKGFVGPVRRCLHDLRLLEYFADVYGHVGTHASYGLTDFDKQSLLKPPTEQEGRFIGKPYQDSWGRKSELMQMIMRQARLQKDQVIYMEDDPKEIYEAKTEQVCQTVQVEPRKGINTTHINEVHKLIVAAKTGTPSVKVHIFIALYDCIASNEDELSFKKGDLIGITQQELLAQTEEEWKRGSLHGAVGLVPMNYLQEVTSQVTAQSQLSNALLETHSAGGARSDAVDRKQAGGRAATRAGVS